MFKASISEWYKRLREGIEDENSGRPNASTTDVNVWK